jgi:alpha-amylase
MLAAFGTSAAVSRAGVMMEGFYWNVPSIGAGNAGADWWYDHLARQANTLKLDGFSAIWIPPELKGASGGYSMGYDPFDDYDLGSKNQMSTVTTRFGTRTQLERMCAMMHASSLQIYADLVNNHRDGDPGNYVYSYLGAYGTAGAGRFPKQQTDFHPYVAQDPNVPAGSGENFNEFGRDLAPINATPSGYVSNGLNAAGDWLTKALDLNGYRMDDVYGISTNWLTSYLGYNSLAGKFAVGEYYDYTESDLEYWIQTMMSGRASAFDFPLRGDLKAMCNTPSSFNMAQLDHDGLTGADPTHSVTFVDNHDTDQSDPVSQNKMLAYAYILTAEGYPCVFYKDWSADSGCYNLGTYINNLIWIHENLASGTTLQRYKNNLFFVYERQGGQHLLVGLNNNTGYDYVCSNVQTGFGNNVHLHDYTGHCPDVYTNGSGQVTITLPVATNGMGYCAYAPAGITGSFTAPVTNTTQEYAGATDLDIKPADNTTLETVGQVWCAASQTINEALYFTTTSWTSSTYIYVEVDNPSGTKIASGNYYSSTAQGTKVNATASTAGFYTFKIRSYNTPSGNPKPTYWMDINYHAPQTASGF